MCTTLLEVVGRLPPPLPPPPSPPQGQNSVEAIYIEG